MWAQVIILLATSLYLFPFKIRNHSNKEKLSLNIRLGVAEFSVIPPFMYF